MKKVLFYIHSLNKGGAERVLLTIASKLTASYEVVILTDKFDEREYELPKKIERIDLETIMNQNQVTVSTFNRIKELRRQCKNINADCIISFMVSSAMRIIVANMFTGRKVVAAVRANPYEDYSNVLKRRLLNFLFAQTKSVVCQTDMQVEFFDKIVQKKCSVIINPLFDEFRNITYAKERSQRIVATGRLFDYKNHELLIRAFAKIAGKYPDITVEIFGEGPYRKELESIIEECHLQDRVLLPGDSSQVAKDIKDALIYVLPSDTEGMPNALMEAMALGLPVISTDCPCGGPRTLIKDKINGLLVPVGDVDAMADAMKLLLDDASLRDNIAQKATHIQEICDIDYIVRKWKDVIE